MILTPVSSTITLDQILSSKERYRDTAHEDPNMIAIHPQTFFNLRKEICELSNSNRYLLFERDVSILGMRVLTSSDIEPGEYMIFKKMEG